MKTVRFTLILANLLVVVSGCTPATDAPLVQLERAKLLVERNNPDEAIEILDQLAVSLNENPEVFYTRGTAYESLGDAEQALKDYTEALRIEPDVAAFLNDRAVLLARQDRFPEAVVDLQHLVDLEPGNASAWVNFGLIWQKQREYAKADVAYQRAAAIAPDAELRFLQGCLAFEQKKYEEAEGFFTNAIAANEKMAKAWLNRGLCRVYGKKIEDAVTDVRQARRLDEDMLYAVVIDVLLRSIDKSSAKMPNNP